MTTIDAINFAGLILNIIGGFILTFSSSKFSSAIHGTLAIYDMQIKAIVNRDDRILDADIANLLKKGAEDSRKKTLAGLVIVIIGFVVQLIPYVLSILKVRI